MAELAPKPDRTSHPFLTYDMIHEMPASVRETLSRNGAQAQELGERLRGEKAYVFTGCGTAFHAALLGEQVFLAAEGAARRSLSVQAFELARYTSFAGPATAVLGVSHSGITRTTVDALRSAKAAGAATVGITHFEGRPIASAVDDVMVAGNGPDRSRCHTKCYTASAAAAAQLALAILSARRGRSRARLRELEAQLATLPEIMDRVVRSAEPEARRTAEAQRTARTIWVTGAGPNWGTALEMALKIQETSFLPAGGLETEQFIHGGWMFLDPTCVLFVVATRGSARERSLDILRAAREVRAPTIAVVTEGDREAMELADTSFETPEVDEYLSPYLNIIPLYLYAYFASVARGHNPDVLRYPEPPYWAARGHLFPPGTH